MNEKVKNSDCEFSVSFNNEDKNNNYTSDSETGLQIDVAEVDDDENPSKRRRLEINDMLVLDEVEEELERQLDAKAAKTNLTATNVKNIIKHVITNEHVLAMVNNSLNNSEEGVVFEPKLTRAKAKELSITQPNIPWSLTPAKKPKSSKVQVLIDQELPEDSSDEEYHPDQDQPSEDEGEGNVTLSDIDSEPPTPVVASVPETTVGEPAPVDVQYDTDELFKIPGIPHVPTEEESIGQRTRSKLSLSKIPIEDIEKAFIPPDITIDMYDWDYDKDPTWTGFLNSFTNPDAEGEDDTEADPEYNILEDRDEELLDKEEFRADKAVKITRKELNDLVAEMVEFVDIYLPESNDAAKKKKSLDNSQNSTQNVPQNNLVIDYLPHSTDSELAKALDNDFHSLLEVQFQQHIQLMTQHFLMTYQHPKLHDHAVICKNNLNSITILRKDENSAFNVLNLDEAIDTVQQWEDKFDNKEFRKSIIDKMEYDADMEEDYRKKKRVYKIELDPELKKLIMNSKALLYPQLLPHIPFHSTIKINGKFPYLSSEINLIALGLSDFCPFVASMERKIWKKKMLLMDASQLISQYLMPTRKATALYERILLSRASAIDNPIKTYFETNYVPPVVHCLNTEIVMRAPKDQPISFLPQMWQSYLEYKDDTPNESMVNIMYLLSSPTDNMIIDSSFRTPIVNMLKSTSTRESAGKKSVRQNANSTENKEDLEAKKAASSSTLSVQTRKTTPRLAKIRSAQNMKLMTQVSGSKNLSSCNSEPTKSNSKDESAETSKELIGSSKGDNEDEIAELMIASTTIKKDTVNRKKAKQARESENIKRMLEAENELEERATKSAESFFQQLHMTLESSNPELLRLVIKLCTDYNEKKEKLNETVNETREQQEKTNDLLDQLAINLYKEITQLLKGYPSLCDVFLLFLKSHQAAMINKLEEHMMSQKMQEFINAAQVYFAKQPSRMQIWPTGKPPQCLFSSELFENLTCPVLPHDKNRIFTEDSPELYENIELPTPAIQDDPYGGDNCKCNCHDTNEPHLKTRTEHCTVCGLRYLNGRLYLQTSEGLRPAKVEFPGDEEEKLENLSRVSLKTTDKTAPAAVPSTSRRRKSSKNDINTDELAQKQCLLKTSPVKDNDDSDRGTSKSKRGGKSPPKSLEHRRLSKSTESNANSNVLVSSSLSSATTTATTSTNTTSTVLTTTANEVTSPLKSKREKRAERREAKAESKNVTFELNKFNEMPAIVNDQHDEPGKEIKSDNEEFIGMNDCNEENNLTDDTTDNLTVDPSNESMSVDDSINNNPWTRQEDALLLQHMQKDYSENSFVTVSEILGNRTVEEVKDRCQTLLSLLEKIL
ncbi:uncharacterized protein LOC103572896 isoform X2 [Microplitis demolitor]|uniref:uncharacterized protein LOC103572896 isoform X2 n=1 Tax=Microplitis demolitor TaxID=69319 RepID=UPI0004CCBE05|nr:uncharacterized protein LOC103572896 isoform X2 [Microplitis demolitor]